MEDPRAPKHGLSSCLRVPIAAKSIAAITEFVGSIDSERIYRGMTKAICVKPYDHHVVKSPDIRLWEHATADEFERQLHPDRQVWVHVDYTAYRRVYMRFGMPKLKSDEVLDHIQNRIAIRLKEYSHPYLRLCPVNKLVNSSGGSAFGIEGMEKQHIRDQLSNPDTRDEFLAKMNSYDIIYADPTDLTKMCNLAPGTKELPEVGAVIKLFYASW